MADTLAPRAIIGVMTPAMNTVVQPELELLRPAGVTNQMQRFRLGGDAVSDDLPGEAAKLMDCNPAAFAIGLTTDAGPGGPAKLAARCRDVADQVLQFVDGDTDRTAPRAVAVGRLVLDRLVAACRESPIAHARQHDDSDRIVPARILQRIDHLLHGLAAEGVQLVGAIDRDRRHAIGPLIEDVFVGHDSFRFVCAAG